MPMNIFENAFIKALFCIEYLAGRSREAPTLSIRRMWLPHCRKDCSVLTMPLANGDCCQSFKEEEEDEPPEEDMSSCSLQSLLFSLSDIRHFNKYSFICDSMECPLGSRTCNPKRQPHLVTHLCGGMFTPYIHGA